LGNDIERIEPRFSDPPERPADADGLIGDTAAAGALDPAHPAAPVVVPDTDRPAILPKPPLRERVAKAAADALAVSRNTTVLQFHQSALALKSSATGWMSQHERALSMAAMVGGFAFDNYAFRRIDLPNTQAVFVGYLVLASLAMVIQHHLAARAATGKPWPKWRTLLPMATQFALGGLWSAFLVFYSRSAVPGASWPFLLLLTAILVGNEVFKRYHSRLVFTAILFFFALFSYTIVTLPILTHTIGIITFFFSGMIALTLFWVFCRLLRRMGLEQWQGARYKIIGGVALVFLALNAFYLSGILPPLPLAMADGGIYHSVAKQGDEYQAVGEEQSWLTRFGATPVLHVTAGESLYFYSAVFAPIRLSTRVIHRWQHYDTQRKAWRTVSKLGFTINGGRDGGYRGYSITHHVVPGDWRADVELPDGHIIGRVRFRVEAVPQPAATQTKTLS